MRIVTLSEAAGEWLAAIGVAPAIVGRAHRDRGEAVRKAVPVTRPSEATRADDDAPRDPFVPADDVDARAIERLAPDLLVAASRAQASRLRAAGVAGEIALFAPTTFRDMLTAVLALGHRVGEGPRTMAAIAEREKALALQRTRSGISKQQEVRQSVLIVSGTDPILCGGYWCADLVALAGAAPVFSDPGEPPRALSAEEVATHVPDHLVAARPPDGREAFLVPPIAAGQVHILPDDRVLFHAGPGLYDTVHWLIDALDDPTGDAHRRI